MIIDDVFIPDYSVYDELYHDTDGMPVNDVRILIGTHDSRLEGVNNPIMNNQMLEDLQPDLTGLSDDDLFDIAVPKYIETDAEYHAFISQFKSDDNNKNVSQN